MTTPSKLIPDEPLSPDPPGWGLNYSPSMSSPGFIAIHGRRRARILNGQDPTEHPQLFTPQVNVAKFKWPTDKEASDWAEAQIKKVNPESELFEKKDTPHANNENVSPETSVAAVQNSSIGDNVAVMPFKLD